MSKPVNLAFIGDVHLGNPNRMGGAVTKGINRRGQQVTAVYERAVTAALDNGATHIVQVGDLFDTMRPVPQQVAAARSIHAIAKERGAKIILLKGNHDSESDEAGDNAIAMLEEPHVLVADVQQTLVFGDTALHCMPFRGGVVDEWLPDAMVKRDIDHERNILVMHAGVRTGATPPWLQNSPDSISEEVLDHVCEHYSLDLVVTGHWHEFLNCGASKQIYQLGALCPTGFNNLGIDEYGTVLVLKGQQLVLRGIPGPRFLKSSWIDGSLREIFEDLPKSNHYYIEFTARNRDDAAIAKQQATSLIEEGVLAAVDVRIQATESKARAVEAATQAAETSGIPEAVTAYVAKEVPAAKRAAVTTRTLKYLGV